MSLSENVNRFESWEGMRQCIAMLRIVAMGEKDVDMKRMTPLKEGFEDIRMRIRKMA